MVEDMLSVKGTMSADDYCAFREEQHKSDRRSGSIALLLMVLPQGAARIAFTSSINVSIFILIIIALIYVNAYQVLGIHKKFFENDDNNKIQLARHYFQNLPAHKKKLSISRTLKPIITIYGILFLLIIYTYIRIRLL